MLVTAGRQIFKIFLFFLLTFRETAAIISNVVKRNKYLEMSRSWSSAHDWKSCIPQKGIESSNLSISAKKDTAFAVSFLFIFSRFSRKTDHFCCFFRTISRSPSPQRRRLSPIRYSSARIPSARGSSTSVRIKRRRGRAP